MAKRMEVNGEKVIGCVVRTEEEWLMQYSGPRRGRPYSRGEKDFSHPITEIRISWGVTRGH